jgi:hypothetical protein
VLARICLDLGLLRIDLCEVVVDLVAEASALEHDASEITDGSQPPTDDEAGSVAFVHRRELGQHERLGEKRPAEHDGLVVEVMVEQHADRAERASAAIERATMER